MGRSFRRLLRNILRILRESSWSVCRLDSAWHAEGLVVVFFGCKELFRHISSLHVEYISGKQGHLQTFGWYYMYHDDTRDCD